MPAPGGSKRRRRSRAGGGGHGEAAGGAERWLVTYADMLTLLLVLFIVLFSISVVNTSKFEELKHSLASAFGVGGGHLLPGGTALNDQGANAGQQVVVGNNANGSLPQNQLQQDVGSGMQVPSVQPVDYSRQVQQQLNNFKQIKKSIVDALAPQGMQNDVEFAITPRGMVITVVTSDLLFGPNSADLLGKGDKLLAAIAPALVHYPNNLEVDGYTNQDNVSTYPFPNGWALSGARAATVADYLQHQKIPETRLNATAMNDKNPKYTPGTQKASKYNRRVEILVLSTLPDAAGAQLAAAGAGL
jgi:chemotaxis protein MotB